MTEVVLDRVGKTFRSRRAISDIDLLLGSGVTAVLGPNGVGKTTLLRLIATAIQPTRGHIRIGGIDARHTTDLMGIRAGLGYAPDSNEVRTRLSVLEFLYQVGALKDMTETDRTRAIDEVIEGFDLGRDLHRSVREVSSGVIRRLLIAQAMLGRPKLLVLDEPFTDLDIEARRTVTDVLKNREGSPTVVMAGHHLEDMAAIAKRILILHGGRVAFDGTPTQLADAGNGETSIEAGYLRVVRRRKN